MWFEWIGLCLFKGKFLPVCIEYNDQYIGKLLLGEMFLDLHNTATLIMEKAMASHSSTLAWKMPWTEEPGGLQSMGSLRVGHD